MTPGASGGGVFDIQGRVVGVILGGSGNEDRHLRAELFRKHWTALTAGNSVDVLEAEPMAEINAEFRQIAKRLHPITVRVLCDGKQRVLGTIVGSDGLILTKLSELKGAISCRLSDGRVLPATVQKKSHEHDLAILKIDANDLPNIHWSQDQEIDAGTLVASLLPGQQPKIGVVCLASRPSPSMKGGLGVEWKQNDDGPTVGDFTTPIYGMKLRKGDVVLRIGDHPLPNVEAYDKLLGSVDGIGDAGQEVRVRIRRNGKERVLRCELRPLGSHNFKRMSRRWWGFPKVLGTDIRLTPRQCGSPLIDRDGHVVGIVIACRSEFSGWGLRHVVPARVARAVISK